MSALLKLDRCVNQRSIVWDEYSPTYGREAQNWSTTDRGWLTRPAVMAPDGVHYEPGARECVVDGRMTAYVPVGFYLDYGPEHYRSSHQYCRDGDCADCEPGNVLAVRSERNDSRYCLTVAAAKAWIELAV